MQRWDWVGGGWLLASCTEGSRQVQRTGCAMDGDLQWLQMREDTAWGLTAEGLSSSTPAQAGRTACTAGVGSDR